MTEDDLNEARELLSQRSNIYRFQRRMRHGQPNLTIEGHAVPIETEVARAALTATLAPIEARLAELGVTPNPESA